MDNLKAIEKAKARLASLTGCSSCHNLAAGYANRTIAEAEHILSRTSPRVVKVAKRILARRD